MHCQTYHKLLLLVLAATLAGFQYPVLAAHCGKLIIAHRGAAGYYPENTIPAIQNALDLGADGVEVDLRLSADNVIVLSHDPGLKRTAGSSLHVRNSTWAQLSNVSVHAPREFGTKFHGIRMARLDEVLKFLADNEARYRNQFLMMDMRVAGLVPVLTPLLKKYPQLMHRLVFACRRTEQGEELMAALGPVALMKEEDEWPEDFNPSPKYFDLHVKRGFGSFSVNHELATTTFVDAARGHFMPIIAWTPRTKEAAWRLFTVGVDGIGTDWPDKASLWACEFAGNPNMNELVE